jgi:hypothetical protein
MTSTAETRTFVSGTVGGFGNPFPHETRSAAAYHFFFAAALPKEPPGRGAKKAAAKAPAQKTVAHAKGRSGKAAARR